MRAVLPVDGGKVTVNGQSANVLGVSPQAFRSWTSPDTTAAERRSGRIWARGSWSAPAPRRHKLHLSPGSPIRCRPRFRSRLPFGAQTTLSVPGADAIVDKARSAQLGLAKNFAVLINAPPVSVWSR